MAVKSAWPSAQGEDEERQSRVSGSLLIKMVVSIPTAASPAAFKCTSLAVAIL